MIKNFVFLAGGGNVIEDPYYQIIAAAVIILLSHTFDFIAKKFRIPSVILLISLGMGLTWAFKEFFHVEDVNQNVIPVLNILGAVGLILIVLEAALDLKLEKSKTRMIITAFVVALIILVLTVAGLALIFIYFLEMELLTALLYATPFSIMSSAIVIPSVGSLNERKKEFMIYEATFSDILGIILFFFLSSLNLAEETMHGALLTECLNILLTIIVSVIVSYGLVYFISRVTKKANFFTIFAMLALFYAIGKKFHLSSLITILIFGLILHNTKVFFRGFMEKCIDKASHGRIIEDFKLLTHQSAFLVRTFFFVAFGMIISLAAVKNPQVIIISGLALVVMFAVRFAQLKLAKSKDLVPELFIAPRGLITVLLYFSIPEDYRNKLSLENLDILDGVMFLVIIVTALIMMFALIFTKEDYEVIEDMAIVDENAYLGYGSDIVEESND